MAGGEVGDILRGDVALHGGAGGENYFADIARFDHRLEIGQPQLFRPVTVQRRQPPEQHEITPAVGAGSLDREHVSRSFDHAEQGRVAPGIGTDIAQLGIGEITAAPAVPHRLQRRGDRLGNSPRAVAVALEQMQRHALRRFLSDTG